MSEAASGSVGAQRRQPLYLHVGLPKSGTTFLQAVLAGNRQRLKGAGFIYPFVRREAMFHAGVELRDQHELWGLDPERIAGTWARLLDRARRFPGAAVISHEVLAGSSAEVVARVGAETAEFDLHVVVTARDVSRQVAAHWQEGIKNGRPWSFAEFEEALFDEDESVRAEYGFWRSQDLVDVVRRWSAIVPADRVLIVVGPPPGAPPDELWRRFAVAIGLDPTTVDLGVVNNANDSLGVVQAALLRSVVVALGGRLQQPAYAQVVKRYFAQQVLSRQRSPRPVAPPALAGRLQAMARGWVDQLGSAGHRTVGDLGELVPVTTPHGERHPDDVAAEELAEAVPEVVAELLLETSRLRTARQQEGS